MKRREQGSSLYLDKGAEEVVSSAEMKAQGGLETAPVIRRRKFMGRMDDPVVLLQPIAFTEAERCC